MILFIIFMNTVKLNALKKQAHKTAVEHGFYGDGVKPVSFYFGLVMSEAGAINAERKGLHADVSGFEEDDAKGITFAENFRQHVKDSVEDEIADIVIRLLDYAGLKKYKLHLIDASRIQTDYIVKGEYLAADLFSLMGFLSDVPNGDNIELSLSMLICIFSKCFGMFTGSDKDLWWFVAKKMQYNEHRPMLNGKKY